MPTLQTYRGVYLWKYIPNFPLALTSAILFLLLSLAHTRKMYKQKSWFCIPFIVGGFLEPIGYLFRAISTHHTGSLATYLIQTVCILLAPCLFAVSLYMVYSRVVRAVHGERFSLLSPRWSTRFFITGDFICLNIQSGGAGLLPHNSIAKYGNGIVVAGLLLQVIVFAGFMYCCVLFHTKFRAHVAQSGGQAVDIPWESVLWMLYVTSVIISIRNVFRLIEFIAGHDNYLFANEWPAYVFDGVLMLLVMLGFYIWYPPQLQPNASTDSMIELRGEEYRPETANGRREAEHSSSFGTFINNYTGVGGFYLRAWIVKAWTVHLAFRFS